MHGWLDVSSNFLGVLWVERFRRAGATPAGVPAKAPTRRNLPTHTPGLSAALADDLQEAQRRR